MTECQEYIKTAKPILAWKGTVLKFLVDMISFMSCGHINSLGFFAKTDSDKILEKFEGLCLTKIQAIQI